eukprot:3458179-Rhodomonas_salina.1
MSQCDVHVAADRSGHRSENEESCSMYSEPTALVARVDDDPPFPNHHVFNVTTRGLTSTRSHLQEARLPNPSPPDPEFSTLKPVSLTLGIGGPQAKRVVPGTTTCQSRVGESRETRTSSIRKSSSYIAVALLASPRRSAHTPKLNTRNHIPGTKCTEIAVSCIVFRGGGQKEADRADLVEEESCDHSAHLSAAFPMSAPHAE